MNRFIHLFCLAVTATFIILSCSKKGNSRSGEEEPQSTTTTTGGTSTTGGTTGSLFSGQATGTITGSPSCTLNPMQVISSNYLSSMTLNTGGTQQLSTLYDLYNFNSSYFVHVYFTSTMTPATGGYSVVPNNNPTSSQVSVEIRPNGGSGYIGNGQSGIVYVTNTGTLVTAVFCNLPFIFVSGANSYSSSVSARIEK